METTNATSIIWVGPAGSDSRQCLAASLFRHGFSLAICENTDQLSQLLSRTPKAVVVVVDDPKAVLVDAALAALERLYRSVPVVVLAEQSTFARCYDLMGRGVLHVYELGEAPDRIARAVQHTAARAA